MFYGVFANEVTENSVKAPGGHHGYGSPAGDLGGLEGPSGTLAVGPEGLPRGKVFNLGGAWAPRGVPMGPHGGPQGSPYGQNTHKFNAFYYLSKNEKRAPGSPKRGQGGSWAPPWDLGPLLGETWARKANVRAPPGPPKRAPDDQKGFAGDDSVVSGASKGLFSFIKIQWKYVYFEHLGPSGGPRKIEKITPYFLGGS